MLILSLFISFPLLLNLWMLENYGIHNFNKGILTSFMCFRSYTKEDIHLVTKLILKRRIADRCCCWSCGCGKMSAAQDPFYIVKDEIQDSVSSLSIFQFQFEHSTCTLFCTWKKIINSIHKRRNYILYMHTTFCNHPKNGLQLSKPKCSIKKVLLERF